MYNYDLIGMTLSKKSYLRAKAQAEAIAGQPIGGGCFWLYNIGIEAGRRIGPPWMKVVNSPNVVCSKCGQRIGVVRMYNDEGLVCACPRCGIYDVPSGKPPKKRSE
jgi:hypothetical protein